MDVICSGTGFLFWRCSFGLSLKFTLGYLIISTVIIFPIPGYVSFVNSLKKVLLFRDLVFWPDSLSYLYQTWHWLAGAAQVTHIISFLLDIHESFTEVAKFLRKQALRDHENMEALSVSICGPWRHTAPILSLSKRPALYLDPVLILRPRLLSGLSSKLASVCDAMVVNQQILFVNFCFALGTGN